ncbi:MAG: phage integrase SAM-like domain-containing protein [Bacteroidetes bacterium]|nr:phage integrase SAM-like domain-containing protein [Bacteroidota bacterium]
METNYSISIYLDTRRAKAKGLFPVKVRVYSPAYSKTKFYPTIFNLTEKDFHSTWETTKPRKEYHELKLKIQSVETKANDAAKELSIFSFEQFEKKFLGKTGKSEDVFYHYDQMIEALKSNNQFGTASNYLLSKKSLKQYLKIKTGKEPKKLLLLKSQKTGYKKYENHMVDTLFRSRTTVSMYLRALRTIFNNAKKSNIINVEAYPFGEDKYEIPNGDAVKKSIK